MILKGAYYAPFIFYVKQFQVLAFRSEGHYKPMKAKGGISHFVNFFFVIYIDVKQADKRVTLNGTFPIPPLFRTATLP